MEQNKLGNFYIFVISNSHSFIPQILKVVVPLQRKTTFFSPLVFETQKNTDYQTSKFKLHSFRAFQRHLTDKNPIHGRGTQSQKTQGFCVADFATLSDERRPRSKNFPLFI